MQEQAQVFCRVSFCLARLGLQKSRIRPFLFLLQCALCAGWQCHVQYYSYPYTALQLFRSQSFRFYIGIQK